jgi:hypothetical protein
MVKLVKLQANALMAIVYSLNFLPCEDSTALLSKSTSHLFSNLDKFTFSPHILLASASSEGDADMQARAWLQNFAKLCTTILGESESRMLSVDCLQVGDSPEICIFFDIKRSGGFELLCRRV